jgi:hypothetical protein
VTYQFVHEPGHKESVQVIGGQIAVKVTVHQGSETVVEDVTLWAYIQPLNGLGIPNGPPTPSNEGSKTVSAEQYHSFTFTATPNRRYQVVAEGYQGAGTGRGWIVLNTTP